MAEKKASWFAGAVLGWKGVLAFGVVAVCLTLAAILFWSGNDKSPTKLPLALDIDLGDGVNMEFILLNAKGNAEFLMGVSDGEDGYTNEKPPHKVTLTKPFYMAKYPVTQEQYAKVTGKNPSYFRKGGSGDARLDDVKDKDTRQFPVEEVSWNDAEAFCQGLRDKQGNQTSAAFRQQNYRFGLPTEAQWEYACRAGTTTAYSFGNDPANLGDYAWFSENSGFRTHQVGTRKPNDWGLHDMHGNVWQWCQDFYDGYDVSGDNNDPLITKRSSGHVLRGGSWYIEARRCRAACRCEGTSDYRVNDFGFRVSFRLD